MAAGVWSDSVRGLPGSHSGCLLFVFPGAVCLEPEGTRDGGCGARYPLNLPGLLLPRRLVVGRACRSPPDRWDPSAGETREGRSAVEVAAVSASVTGGKVLPK